MSPDMVPGTELHSTGGKPGQIIVVFGRGRACLRALDGG
jgi:hypothetical protein